MKRLFLFLATLFAFVGCSNEENLTSNIQSRMFTASFEDATTRTYLDDNFKLLWTADDRLTIFTSTLNEQYKFTGNTGDNSGEFTKITTDDFTTGNTISTNYAVYPYSETTSLSNDEVITLTLPAVQNYAENSFGLGANTMVAVTSSADDTFLPFKNLGGYLRLQLYGEGVTVKSITLKGNNSEPLAGEATVVATYGSLPELTLAEDGATSIKLDCGEGVSLGASTDEATAFWLVVPPTTFEGGFAITITDTEGKTMTKSTTKEFSIERNTFKTMNAFEVVTTIPSTIAAANEIIYTSTDDAVVTPYKENAFGATITSNVYEDGVGVITFDGDVTTIGTNAFRNCTTLESIILPNGEAVITRSETTTVGITSIGASAFFGCTDLTSVAIPEGVTTIGSRAFNGCSNLTDVEIPESVTTIGTSAFNNCTSLTSVDIPEGVTTIGSSTFSGCTNLTEIEIPESVTTIGTSAFNGCTSLTSVAIPEGVTTIGDNAFNGCSNLTEIEIPESVTTIGISAFNGCSSLTTVPATPNITKIADTAFSGCESLTEYTIPEGVTSIGYSAFSGCTNLTTITIPEGVTTIGNYAFEGCTALANIKLPNSLKSIGENIFRDCKALTSITIPEGITTISNSAFIECYGLTDINLPNSLTTIETNAFHGCIALKSIDIPANVTTINGYAFAWCSALESITIPESVTTIGSYVFEWCSALATIYCESTTPPTIGINIFSNTSSDIKIYVPAESVDTYKAATNWSDYADSIVGYNFE